MSAVEPLLSRTDFRESVFDRDKGLCVICKEPAVDAHHLIERKLWGDGGYYISNGASLCAHHHIQAEQTVLSVEEIRSAAGITHVLLPPDFYAGEIIDKFGNPVLANGMRMRGELFDDESVQKILAQGNVLHLFTKYVKYPRTMHLPFSPGVSKDDRVLESIDHFRGKEIVATVKLDGENTSLYNDHLHARSLDKGNHASQSWIKGFHAQIGWEIPEGYRICGENMYAAHSIKYDNLSSFFYGFSIWNEQNICLSWDDTVEWFQLLGITPVPVLYRGPFDEELIKNLYQPTWEGCTCEGFVIRITGAFSYKEFRTSIAKYVRENHVTTDNHWRRTWQPNRLRNST